jgi:MFS family permease
VLGPIVGGFVEQFLAWRWNIWIQLIFGGAVQIAHAILVPETRTTVLMDRIAKKRRKEGEKNGKPVNIWGPNELKTFKERFSAREILITWIRPFRMFVTEPIVLVLSLLSGFSDAIIFMFLQSYALVYGQWDFAPYAIGLTFVAIGIGYFLAWFSFFPATLYCALPSDRSHYLRVDVNWPATPLDGLTRRFCHYRNCQLRNLHGHN